MSTDSDISRALTAAVIDTDSAVRVLREQLGRKWHDVIPASMVERYRADWAQAFVEHVTTIARAEVQMDVIAEKAAERETRHTSASGVTLITCQPLLPRPDERRRAQEIADGRDALLDEADAAAGYPDPCERVFDEEGNEL